MKIEIETENPNDVTILRELVRLTPDQRKLIRLALRDYIYKMSRENVGKCEDEGECEDDFNVKTAIELIALHEYENILRKFGMKVGEEAEEPSYFSFVPNDGETPEEFAERVNTRSWLEVDDSEETE